MQILVLGENKKNITNDFIWRFCPENGKGYPFAISRQWADEIEDIFFYFFYRKQALTFEDDRQTVFPGNNKKTISKIFLCLAFNFSHLFNHVRTSVWMWQWQLTPAKILRTVQEKFVYFSRIKFLNCTWSVKYLWTFQAQFKKCLTNFWNNLFLNCSWKKF